MQFGIQKTMLKGKLYRPHTKQREIHDAINQGSEMYYLLNIGRQFGKTKLAENQAVYWSQFPKSKIGWVSPTYKQALKSFNSILKAIQDTPIFKRKNESQLVIHFVNGSSINFFSAESDDNLRGNTFDYLIVDEFAFVKQSTWQYVLRATIMVKGKKCLLISTPKGKNHFFDLCNEAKVNPRYRYFKGTSYDNPFTNIEELEDIKKTLPEDVFKQEYLAEFVDSASVFKNIDKAVISYQPECEYKYIGIDIGFQNDYTVITTINEDKEVTAIDRFKGVGTKETKERILKAIEGDNTIAYLELNNQGLPIFDELVNEYNLHHKLQGFNTTHKSKSDIINGLIKDFNEEVIKIPNDEDLILELESFIYKVSSTGVLRFEAMSGFHDDMVMSLAIANKCHNENKNISGFAYSF